MIIIDTATVSEAHNCISVLRLYHYDTYIVKLDIIEMIYNDNDD